MSENMRQLASTLVAAANTYDENKRLRRQIEELTSQLDSDKQLQIIRQLRLKIQELERDADLREIRLKTLREEKGQQKHRADILEVKVQTLERKAAAVKIPDLEPRC